MSVWPDLADASAPPLQARVAGSVCAVAAAPSPNSSGTVVAFATADGALHILQVLPELCNVPITLGLTSARVLCRLPLHSPDQPSHVCTGCRAGVGR